MLPADLHNQQVSTLHLTPPMHHLMDKVYQPSFSLPLRVKSRFLGRLLFPLNHTPMPLESLKTSTAM
jgi:hypothetical protein